MNGRIPFGTGSPKAIKQRGALRGGWILADSESTFILLFRGMSKTFKKMASSYVELQNIIFSEKGKLMAKT